MCSTNLSAVRASVVQRERGSFTRCTYCAQRIVALFELCGNNGNLHQKYMSDGFWCPESRHRLTTNCTATNPFNHRTIWTVKSSVMVMMTFANVYTSCAITNRIESERVRTNASEDNDFLYDSHTEGQRKRSKHGIHNDWLYCGDCRKSNQEISPEHL